MTTLIKPYESVGEFVFGESLENIQKKLGKPEKLFHDEIIKAKIETRGKYELMYEEDKLVAVTCFKDSDVELNGVSPFKCTIDDIKKMDPDSREGEDGRYVIFRNLGICIGGMLEKRIPEGKLLIAFSRDQLSGYEVFIDV